MNNSINLFIHCPWNGFVKPHLVLGIVRMVEPRRLCWGGTFYSYMGRRKKKYMPVVSGGTFGARPLTEQ
jgi:hypothetical protein